MVRLNSVIWVLWIQKKNLIQAQRVYQLDGLLKIYIFCVFVWHFWRRVVLISNFSGRMFCLHKYSFFLDVKEQNKFYKTHIMPGYFSSTCGLNMSPYGWILLSKKYFFCEKIKNWKNEKIYFRIKNGHFYFAKTLGWSFPHTSWFHWCVENSDQKCLQIKYVRSSRGDFFYVSIFLRRIFFFL